MTNAFKGHSLPTEREINRGTPVDLKILPTKKKKKRREKEKSP